MAVNQQISAMLPGTSLPQSSSRYCETLQCLLDSLRNESLRTIALAGMESSTNQEIADVRGIGLRSIERKLQLIRENMVSGTR